MRPGYNHNIRYKNLTLHLQTEDLGPHKATCVTHLFCKGLVVESVSVPYTPNATASDEDILQLMQKQHTDMLKKLFEGHYDAQLPLNA